MRASRLFIHTQKEDPAEAELASHRLMLRAGLIRQLAAGIFSWLPLGWRVVRKIEAIVREEMDAAGAAEIMMPAVQPAELWHDSGRWQNYGPELLRLQDRHQRDYCIGPTHEEVVTDLARHSVTSWRQLPFNLYQIQTKFRDEIRPRYGVMRAREFVMKDAYSFDRDQAGAQASYAQMREAYMRIFSRIGLDFKVVAADSGAIGGSQSEEFLVLADSGEAVIGYTAGDFAANLEQIPCAATPAKRPAAGAAMQRIDTPGVTTIEQLQDFLPARLPMDRCIKTMIVVGEAGVAAVLLAGDARLNLAKAGQQPQIGAAARLADADEAAKAIGASFGSLGPVDMPLPVIADHQLAGAADFACGANADGAHLLNVNFGRDCPEPAFADVRMATAGETAPDGQPLRLRRGIEVGHVFYLGTKYSAAMAAVFETSDDQPSQPIEMGCYGIGITRIVAAAIEQNHDARGIRFPASIAPFSLAILPLGDDERITQAAERIYAGLADAGLDVLYDDRRLRPGAAFADLDLLGIPHRVVVSARSLKTDSIEYKGRADDEASAMPLDGAIEQLAELLGK